ncbi:MAG: hypothetical protein OXF06_03890 [Bacteroidetes bacterium]|nr:hypothetical protein [Bacteroidota bacterium]
MTNLSRFLIFAVILLSIIAVARLFVGPPLPRGSIALTDLKSRELAQERFQVSGQVKVLVDAIGSVDDRQDAQGLAAYPWITQDDTKEVIWSMNESNTILKGSLAMVEQDELTLESGTYTLNFASYGQLLRSSRGEFRKDHGKWNVVLFAPDDHEALRSIVRPLRATSEDPIWQATSLGKNEKKEYFFEVNRSVEFHIQAIGQLGQQDQQPVDYSRIEDAVTGQVVWQLTSDNTVWAGGVRENRLFDGQQVLKPNVYRLVAVTNDRHHYGGWTGNPPYHPSGWGIQLSATQRDAVSIFDPWAMQRDPVITINRIGDDEEYKHAFTVVEPSPVVIYAYGEITEAGPSNRFDFAWLDRQDQWGHWSRIWEMTWEHSVSAGGARKNRQEVSFHRLDPGVYTLGYESDGSHSYDHWNASEPDYPERWGVTMFTVMDLPTSIIVDAPSSWP